MSNDDRMDVEANHEETDDKKVTELTSAFLKNPALLSALQDRLDGYVGTPSGYIEVWIL